MTSPNTPVLSSTETEVVQINSKLDQIITLMTAVPDTTASGGPAAPTGLRGKVLGDKRVALYWNAVPDPDVVWDIHELLANPSETFVTTVTSPTATLGPYVDGLYRFVIHARNSSGRSPASLSFDAGIGVATGSTGAIADSGGAGGITATGSNTVASTTITTITALTPAAYTALATKDPRTLYVTADNAAAAKLSAPVQSSTISTVTALTQAAYDALATKDAKTLYVIVASPPAVQASANVQSGTVDIITALAQATFNALPAKDPRTFYVSTG